MNRITAGCTRRAFLKAGAAAVISPYVITSSALGAGGRPAPSNRIQAANVGVGGQDGGHVQGFLSEPDVQVMAICDVDYGHLTEKRKWVEAAYAKQAPSGNYTGCDGYNDFRDVLARPDIDAILIATPDHWHGLISTMAAKAGKDIYCEKPMAARIADGRAAANAVKRYGRVFQTGSQERSGGARYACELVRNGRLGRIHTIRTYLPTEFHNQGPATAMRVPEGFNYDMWLGPAPWEPYTPQRCHGSFRWILDYSDGELTDRGAHVNDIALWGAEPFLKGPIEIEARGKFQNTSLYNVPIEYHVEYTYASGIKIITESGGNRGIRFEGTEGWVFVEIHGAALTADPPGLLKSVIGPDEVHLKRTRGHRRDWLDAIKTREATVAPAEDGHRTATFCHLAVAALQLGRKIRWDPLKEQFIDDPEADAIIARAMRSPWHL